MLKRLFVGILMLLVLAVAGLLQGFELALLLMVCTRVSSTLSSTVPLRRSTLSEAL